MFPPPAIVPPFERSRRDHDGEWTPLGADSPTLYKTVIHPHQVSHWQTLTVVAIDLNRVSVGYVPGQKDLEDLKSCGGMVPGKDIRAGLVPEAHKVRLLAVFNGGFQPRHGRWGMRVDRTTLLPAKNDGCTVAIDEQNRIVVEPWTRLGDREPELLAYRQTPPCLVNQGELHPLLVRGKERRWAGFDPKRVTRRRSAIGVDASGQVLFYGIGEEMGPGVLGVGMRAVGAVNAAELDINWSWTRFLVFGRTEEPPTLDVIATLIPDTVKNAGEYLERPSARGFFYLFTRSETLSPNPQ